MLREVVDRECVGEIWCASERVKGSDFQACSFNHSDISVSSAPERTTSSTTRTRGSSAGSRTTRSPARAARPDDLEELGLASTAAIIARARQIRLPSPEGAAKGATQSATL